MCVIVPHFVSYKARASHPGCSAWSPGAFSFQLPLARPSHVTVGQISENELFPSPENVMPKCCNTVFKTAISSATLSLIQMHLVQLLTQHQKQHYLKNSLGTAFHLGDEDQITKENFHNYF